MLSSLIAFCALYSTILLILLALQLLTDPLLSLWYINQVSAYGCCLVSLKVNMPFCGGNEMASIIIVHTA